MNFRDLQVTIGFVVDVATRNQDLVGQGTCYETLPLLYCTGNVSWNADPFHLNLTCRHGKLNGQSKVSTHDALLQT